MKTIILLSTFVALAVLPAAVLSQGRFSPKLKQKNKEKKIKQK